MSVNIFISYAHLDNISSNIQHRWLDRLKLHLAPLKSLCDATIWDDQTIQIGDRWEDRILSARDHAKIAVLLISPAFLASHFIGKSELPALLSRARDIEGHLRVVPIVISHCLYREMKLYVKDYLERNRPFTLMEIMCSNSPDRPLLELSEAEQDKVLSNVARQILEFVKHEEVRRKAMPVVPKIEDWDISRLPKTSTPFCGRDEELEVLLRSLQDSQCRLIVIVAHGGLGKSALVNHALWNLSNRKGLARKQVFAWSFFSQGMRDDPAGADEFVKTALEKLRADSSQGSPEAKAQRLADMVEREEALLILDGLEPLQYQGGADKGHVKDKAIREFIDAMAQRGKGKCIITTRQKLPNLNNKAVVEIPLKSLEPKDGADLLHLLGVDGEHGERRKASEEVHGHPLTLVLLGTYLRDICKGDVNARVHVIPDKNEQPIHEVFSAYEQHFQEEERDALRMIGLFDRPAKADELNALRAASIPDLSDAASKLNDQQWTRLVARLRRTGLFSREDPENPDTVDAHPLVRVHFGRRLRNEIPTAWKEGHLCLYKHITQKIDKSPDTFEEMMPLYRAVVHGCHAGEYNAALDNVYWKLIQRGHTGYSHRKFGAFATELEMLSACLDSKGHPRPELSSFWRAAVLGFLGSRLRALGELFRARDRLQQSLEEHRERKDWHAATIRARHLSELYVELGELPNAIRYAKIAIELAHLVRANSDAPDTIRYVSDQHGTYQVIASRSVCAAAYHQLGDHKLATLGMGTEIDRDKTGWELATEEFAAAEAEATKSSSRAPFVLSSLWGMRYCELLLEHPKKKSRKSRQELSQRIQELKATKPVEEFPDVALGPLGEGLISLLEVRCNWHAATGSPERIARIEQIVSNLKNSGRHDFIPLGLLARAEIRRSDNELIGARSDLEEAKAICDRGKMQLHRFDCRLEEIRLLMAEQRNAEAEREFHIACAEIERLHFGRRNRQLAELRNDFKFAQGIGQV
jgi:hypothetical protein